MNAFKHNHYEWIKRLFVSLTLLFSFGCGMINQVIPTPADKHDTDPVISNNSGGKSMDLSHNQLNDDGFSMTLSEGKGQYKPPVSLPVLSGEPLTTKEINTIIDRIPDLPDPQEIEKTFNFPEEILPPPQPGEIVQQQFPPQSEDALTPQVSPDDLEVIRYSPQGEVQMAPLISITFNQPMVPLTSLDQLSKLEIPIQIVPAIKGNWRWIGTKTLTFEFDSQEIDRLPMATEFQVIVPKGMKSAAGKELKQDTIWTFSTPPPRIIKSYPSSGPQSLEPLIFIGFDQRINQTAVLEKIKLKAGKKIIGIRLATEDEIQSDQVVKTLADNHPEGRWLAIKPLKPLPKDTDIIVTVEAGTPSAEGALTTQKDQTIQFQTFPQLRIQEFGCLWYGEKCSPPSPLYIRFNNPLDEEAFLESQISVTPEIPGAVFSAIGNTVNIQGATTGSTNYRITISGEIKDIFGQSLGYDEKISIKVGEAEPRLYSPNSNFVTIDPYSQKPELSLYIVNYKKLDVKIYVVEPQDWNVYQQYLKDFYQSTQKPEPPGKLVFNQVRSLDLEKDKLSEVKIDLSGVMETRYGHFIVVAKPVQGFFDDERPWEWVRTWVQVTQLGLDAFVDHNTLTAWVTDLKTGQPMENVAVFSLDDQEAYKTDQDGIVKIQLPQKGISAVAARNGDDQVIMPSPHSSWNDVGWQPVTQDGYLRWYLINDRGMYKPWEEVSFKGWLRLIGSRQDSDVSLFDFEGADLSYQVYDSQGNLITTSTTGINSFGGFDFSVQIPQKVNLGEAYIQIQLLSVTDKAQNLEYYSTFQIQEFRRPEFEVIARNESSGPYFVDGEAMLAAEAKYYTGGPLSGAEINWQVSASPTNYQPPNWQDFIFGEFQPWWYYFSRDYSLSYPGFSNQEQLPLTFTGITDATGSHFLKLDFSTNKETRPQSILAEAAVTDINQQTWAGRTSLFVHPADLYVGLRSDKYFVAKGEPIKVDLIVTDLDGKAISGKPIQVSAARVTWKYQKGDWVEVLEESQICEIESTLKPVQCSFETPLGGKYQIKAIVTDDKGRKNYSQFDRWVSGGELPPARDIEQETVTLIPDKESYQPGDIAKILVQSPFYPAEGLLTVSRNGVLYTQAFKMKETSHTLEIPIKESQIPNINIQVDINGTAVRVDDKGNLLKNISPRPAFAGGTLSLSIPPATRTLSVSFDPDSQQLAPGENTQMTITVKDHNGTPVSDAEVALIVVDEAILALTDYQLLDPLSVFYSNIPSAVESNYTRANVILVDPATLLTEQAGLPMPAQAASKALMEDYLAEGRGGGGENELFVYRYRTLEEPSASEDSSESPIQLRFNFNPLAIFSPEEKTNQDGKVSVNFKLPDNLTRYRVMAVAADSTGKKFGNYASNLTARLPLMVRLSMTRFLNYGDRFEIPVILQNQTDQDLETSVVVEVSNLNLGETRAMKVIVPANNRVEVRFPGETAMTGEAFIQVVAVAGSYADAARISIPVYTPATSEAFATYGVIDSGAVSQPFLIPDGIIPQFGGLEISTSSTALSSLSDAVLYLIKYPFDCSEQIASRILAIAALKEMLAAFHAEELPTAEEIEEIIIKDIDLLVKMQNHDGGFSFWTMNNNSLPFLTVHVAYALQKAKQMGYTVPEKTISNALNYLKNIEKHYPNWYSLKAKQTISAYALFVRIQLNDSDPAKAKALLEDQKIEDLSLDAIAWIWQVLQNRTGYEQELNKIRAHINNQVVETAESANFVNGYSDEDYVLLHSNRRTDALLLDALISDNPQSDLIPKLINGLQAHRTKGHWKNTQENVFILLAMQHYFNTFENQTPDFIARSWLGENYLMESSFQGYSATTQQVLIPMQDLINFTQDQESMPILLSKEGAGRMYYRLGLKYAPEELIIKPEEMGFSASRTYEAVDDPNDVWLDKDGIWHLKFGARIKVKLNLVADSRRYHVALVDSLPAGLEIINPALAVSETLPVSPEEQQGFYHWWNCWYEHQNMRDSRVEVFTSLLWAGVYEYTYITKATVLGTFITPPVYAEEMYSPETFGRGQSDIVIIE